MTVSSLMISFGDSSLISSTGFCSSTEVSTLISVAVSTFGSSGVSSTIVSGVCCSSTTSEMTCVSSTVSSIFDCSATVSTFFLLPLLPAIIFTSFLVYFYIEFKSVFYRKNFSIHFS